MYQSPSTSLPVSSLQSASLQSASLPVYYVDYQSTRLPVHTTAVPAPMQPKQTLGPREPGGHCLMWILIRRPSPAVD